MKLAKFKLKPLDGSPYVSANCWEVVLKAVEQQAKSEKTVRYLEWGSGNSTISLVKTGLNLGADFEFVSIEHETAFFPWLAESVLDALGSYKSKTKISWQILKGPIISWPQLKEVLVEKRTLKSAFLNWQILLGNKRLQYVDGFEPKFDFSFFKFIKQAVKLVLVELSYWIWLIKGLSRGLRTKTSLVKRYELSSPIFTMEREEIKKKKFFEYFKKKPTAGCLKIQSDNLNIELWHLPEIRTIFWNRGLLLDGSPVQLPDYVGIPLEGKFDIIFVDGRARVSCIKRVYRDKLLKQRGWLFVHDAFRIEMAEGFKLFSNSFKFIRGSNVMLNGQKRAYEEFGPPLIQAGDTVEALKPEIMQELFVYQNL